MHHIERPEYLERLWGACGTPDIKVITGIRRCGKSQLLLDFMELLRTRKPEANLVCIDFNNLEYESLKDYLALESYASSRYHAGASNFLFIDEVQLCPKFELALNSLHSKGLFDIFITGSNAFLQSSDLATFFTGRYVDISVFPFSFSEFLRYHGSADPALMLERYLVAGGLAGSYMYQDETLRRRYLEDIYRTILTRDLVQRYRLSGAGGVLESVSAFLLDNVGNVTSAHRLCGILNAQQRKTNPVTIGNYLDYLCSAFLFYPQHSFDVKGSAYLKGNIKYYLADLGVRYAVQGQRNLDYGRAYENMVALELLRRGYQVYTGKMGALEVDFVALQGSSRWYIQVCDNLDNPQTFEREVTSLLKIKDAYPKVVLARTAHPPYDYKGIAIVDLASYLAGKVLKEADPTLAWYQR